MGTSGNGMVQILTFPTKVLSDSLGRIGSLKRTSDKFLFPMALGSCGHRITHQLRPINMNGRSILAVTSTFKIFEARADFLTPDGLGSCRKRRNFGAHRSLVQSCGYGLAAL